ncbi:MAG: hypothetical protein ABR576_17120 [Thermoanaerobaculia bacterium]
MSRRAPRGVFWLVLACIGAFGGVGCSRVKVVTAKCAGRSFAVKEVVKVKKNQQIIVWSSDATNLKIEWKKADPFPYPVRCDGDQFCAVLAPSRTPGSYPYTIKGTCGGAAAEKDPRVEVIDY